LAGCHQWLSKINPRSSAQICGKKIALICANLRSNFFCLDIVVAPKVGGGSEFHQNRPIIISLRIICQLNIIRFAGKQSLGAILGVQQPVQVSGGDLAHCGCAGSSHLKRIYPVHPVNPVKKRNAGRLEPNEFSPVEWMD
jgi:hypothetical protein